MGKYSTFLKKPFNEEQLQGHANKILVPSEQDIPATNKESSKTHFWNQENPMTAILSPPKKRTSDITKVPHRNPTHHFGTKAACMHHQRVKV